MSITSRGFAPDVEGAVSGAANHQKFTLPPAEQLLESLKRIRIADSGYGLPDNVVPDECAKLGLKQWRVLKRLYKLYLNFWGFENCEIGEFERFLAKVQQPEILLALRNPETKDFDRHNRIASQQSLEQWLGAEPSQHSTNQTPVSLPAFEAKIASEFVTGSAIDPELFAASVEIVPDLIALTGGEVETPLHDLLGWRYTRFGQQAKASLYGAVLRQESGAAWQVKLSSQRTDESRKTVKYETPKGSGARAYLPTVPDSIRQRIGERHGVTAPPQGESFWAWLAQHPEIPIIYTEGGKKALALLSLGYVAISLFGVNGGYRKLGDGSHELIEDLAPFTGSGRPVVLAFDSEQEGSKQSRVALALRRFGSLLEAAGCSVKVAGWAAAQGKGVDDLIVNAGADVAIGAIDSALPLKDWQAGGNRAISQAIARLRLQRQLSLPPSLSLKAEDLSRLELGGIPESGIVAVCSPKGTGKTKFIGQLVSDTDRVLAAGHRRVLMRNLGSRLGLDYIGELDRAGGEFVSGCGYSLRVSFCVDSLLAIDPDKFAGCDLVIDEVTQVLRHLLQSSTCNKDGKRPALLGVFFELVKRARRVIVADADLDDSAIEFLQAVRGDGQKPFLIRNDLNRQTYPCRFIECSDSSAITALLIEAAKALAESWKAIELGLASGPKKAIWIACDSKAETKRIAARLEAETGLKALAVHSETSGDGPAKALICNPDQVIAEQQFAFYVCSPSVGTGVSVEIAGHFAAVYGLFSGVSLSDGDMGQSLVRIRELVERTVWVARCGRAFNKISRSTKAEEIHESLKRRSAMIARLVGGSLQPSTREALENQDWADSTIRLYSEQAAAQNWSQWNLRDALLTRLQFEGAAVTVEERDPDRNIKALLKETQQQITLIQAQEIATARDLTLAEKLDLESSESATPEDRAAIAKFNLQDFYKITSEEITVDFVLADKGGRRRAEIASLEAQVNGEIATDRTVKAIEKAFGWGGQHVCPWDISDAALRVEARRLLGLNDFLEPGKTWTKYDLKPYADKIRQYAKDVKIILGMTISDKISDTQVVHQLLSQMGLKIKASRTRRGDGTSDNRLKIYQLDSEAWQTSLQVIERRKQARESVSPVESDSDNWLSRFESAETDSELQAAYTAMAERYPAPKHPAKQAVWEQLERSLKLRIQRLLRDIPEAA
ncbi:MAG: plasmid replication protein, CyRepA1 family [Elainella sp.]